MIYKVEEIFFCSFCVFKLFELFTTNENLIFSFQEIINYKSWIIELRKRNIMAHFTDITWYEHDTQYTDITTILLSRSVHKVVL